MAESRPRSLTAPLLNLGIIIYLWSAVQHATAIRLPIGTSSINGTIESVPSGRTERQYFAFRGIPYAVPPLGERRWKDPELLELKERDYDGTKYGQKCTQWSGESEPGGGVIGGEDCLFLNIFTPSLPSRGGAGISRALNPVMVYIHGGAFVDGAGEEAGPGRFIRHDVVFVTLNYRLGTLGFLSTGTKELGGNWGLLDQIVALEWIQKYISSFGGNPKRVTIFGHSAGAASVHLLTLSKRATGKFQQAIIQSGSALCDWSVERNPLEYATKVASKANCSTDSVPEMVQCLRQIEAADLVKIQVGLHDYWVMPLKLSPVLDADARGPAAFLPEPPADIMDKGAFNPVPIVTGVTDNEGFIGYAILRALVGRAKFENQTYFMDELIPRILRGLLEGDNHVVTEAVQGLYFNGLNVSEPEGLQAAVTELSNLFGDTLFNACHRDMLEKYARLQLNTSVYSYVFTHKRPDSPKIAASIIEGLRKDGTEHPLFDSTVPHVEDMFYLFEPMGQYPGTRAQRMTSGLDLQVAEILTRTWFAFARDGNLSAGLQGLSGYPPWEPIRPGSINYYNLSSGPAPMGADFRKQESLFWLRTVPLLTQLSHNVSELEAKLEDVEGSYNCFRILFWILLALAIIFLLVALALAYLLWRKRTTGKATL